MSLTTGRNALFREISSHGAFAAIMLLACSGPMGAQSSQPDVCHMDSDGFCVAAAAIQTTPIVIPVVHENQMQVAPQNQLQIGSSPTSQSQLRVEFHDGLLRIDAENATLRDTLKSVSARTGAEMQFPTGGMQERIFVHLGPAAPRDVVSQLLNGTPFNYLILSSVSEPTGMTRLILSRTSASSESAALSADAITANESGPQVYGAAFGVDPDAPAAEPVAIQTPDAAATPGTNPVPNWVHGDGPKLSAESLDQMQKAQIQQEQQQFAQQLQQQRQQQEQPSPNPPSQ
jgi:hypothetical protein